MGLKVKLVAPVTDDIVATTPAGPDHVYTLLPVPGTVGVPVSDNVTGYPVHINAGPMDTDPSVGWGSIVTVADVALTVLQPPPENTVLTE